MTLSKLRFLLFVGLFLLLSCAKKPTLATIRAAITDGSTSAVVNVFFTQYTAVFSNDTLQVVFSDGSGNTMSLGLRGSGGDLPTTSYDVDGSQNSLEAELVVTSNLEPQVISVNANGGFINVNSIDISGTAVTGFSGDFNVNFETGGSGQGTYNTND